MAEAVESVSYFIAEDYAGMMCRKYSFYYGYEETTEKGDDSEWCFVAKENGVEISRIASSLLGVGDPFDVVECLLAGIGIFLDSRS